MFETPLGDRTLHGAERRLFMEALASLVDEMSLIDCDSGIEIFDSLQRNQKITVLLGVSKALLRDNVAPPPLMAISEAAVAAVYQHLRDQVAVEIQDDDGDGEFACTSWRSLVLAACRETTEMDSLPRTNNKRVAKWSFLIDCLRDRILWDTDWEMVEQLDTDQEDRQTVNERLGIDDDYYVWVPPDPPDVAAEKMFAELHDLTPECRPGKPSENDG